jgi:predicted O-methyltransferase YrrM
VFPGLAQRRYRHLTPRYMLDRARVIAHERCHPQEPWLTSESVAFLERWLEPDRVGFEWGSGRSTVWFAQRVRRLISVEHDPHWYAEVTQRLEQKGLAPKVFYYRFVVDDFAGSDQPYVSAISEHHDGGLDFCLVDGVIGLRAHCALACLPKLRRGGLAIVDNANWFLPREPKSRAPNSRGLPDGYASAAWREFDRQVADWPCTWISNGVTDTAIWTKPACSSAAANSVVWSCYRRRSKAPRSSPCHGP